MNRYPICPQTEEVTLNCTVEGNLKTTIVMPERLFNSWSHADGPEFVMFKISMFSTLAFNS